MKDHRFGRSQFSLSGLIGFVIFCSVLGLLISFHSRHPDNISALVLLGLRLAAAIAFLWIIWVRQRGRTIPKWYLKWFLGGDDRYSQQLISAFSPKRTSLWAGSIHQRQSMAFKKLCVVVGAITALWLQGPALAQSKGDQKLFALAWKGGDLTAQEIADARSLTDECSFVERRKLAPEVINALASIIFQSGRDPDFQQTCLDMAYDRIGIDIDAEGYAELADLVSLAQRRDQPFGSYGRLEKGRVESMGDDYVDTERSRAGLPTIDSRVAQINDTLKNAEWAKLQRRALALPQSHYPSNLQLRRQLMDMLAADQYVRSDRWQPAHPGESQTDAMKAVDRVNLPVVSNILLEKGFPGGRGGKKWRGRLLSARAACFGRSWPDEEGACACQASL